MAKTQEKLKELKNNELNEEELNDVNGGILQGGMLGGIMYVGAGGDLGSAIGGANMGSKEQ